MGYVFNFHDARSYATWIARQNDPWTSSLQTKLMIDLLKPSPGESILDIGCGTGASALPLIQMGLNVTGIDPSPYMLDISLVNLGSRVDLYRGIAEDLPFGDNSFNYALFFITLEFVEDPAKAIAEACRVAKDKIFIGFFNRYALKGVQRWFTRFFSSSVFNYARFFSVWELKRLVRSMAGPVPIRWRTVCQLPGGSARIIKNFEQSRIVQYCPFGAFGGMAATVMPRFRTRPLAIRYQTQKPAAVVPGSAPVGSTASGCGDK